MNSKVVSSIINMTMRSREVSSNDKRNRSAVIVRKPARRSKKLVKSFFLGGRKSSLVILALRI